jgi:CRP-like cAMP-binding protein
MFKNWAKNTLMKASYFFVEKTFTRKTMVYREGAPASHLYIVIEGEFKFFKSHGHHS